MFHLLLRRFSHVLLQANSSSALGNHEYEQLTTLNHSIGRLTETIATSVIINREVRFWMVFTGIDCYSTILLLNKIGPIGEFQSLQELARYAGLASSTRRSSDRTANG